MNNAVRPYELVFNVTRFCANFVTLKSFFEKHRVYAGAKLRTRTRDNITVCSASDITFKAATS